MNIKTIDRRKSQRLEKRMTLSVIYKSEEENIQVEEYTITHNISRKGARIILPAGLPKDKLLNLKIFLFSDPIAIPAKARVVWSEKKENIDIELSSSKLSSREKVYWIGIEFIDIDEFTQGRIIRFVEKEFV